MKTTKTHVEPVSSIIQYQLRKGIKSITVGGKSDLMDLEIDKKGNVTLVMNADKDKLDVEKFEEYKNAFIDFINEYDKELFKYLNNKEWILKTDTPNLISISYEPTDDPDINKTVLNILHDDTKLNIKDFEKFAEDNEQIINTIQEMVANHTETLTRLETTTDTLTITLDDTITKTTDNTTAITENKTSIDELKEKTQKLESEKASLKDLNNLSETVENDIQIVREKTVLNDTNIKELEKEVNTNKDNIIEVKENINEIVNNFETIENDLDAHKKAVKDNLKVNNLKLDDLENIAQEIVEKIDNVKKVEVVGDGLIDVTVEENEKTITYTIDTKKLEKALKDYENKLDIKDGLYDLENLGPHSLWYEEYYKDNTSEIKFISIKDKNGVKEFDITPIGKVLDKLLEDVRDIDIRCSNMYITAENEGVRFNKITHENGIPEFRLSILDEFKENLINLKDGLYNLENLPPHNFWGEEYETDNGENIKLISFKKDKTDVTPIGRLIDELFKRYNQLDEYMNDIDVISNSPRIEVSKTLSGRHGAPWFSINEVESSDSAENTWNTDTTTIEQGLYLNLINFDYSDTNNTFNFYKNVNYLEFNVKGSLLNNIYINNIMNENETMFKNLLEQLCKITIPYFTATSDFVLLLDKCYNVPKDEVVAPELTNSTHKFYKNLIKNIQEYNLASEFENDKIYSFKTIIPYERIQSSELPYYRFKER